MSVQLTTPAFRISVARDPESPSRALVTYRKPEGHTERQPQAKSQAYVAQVSPDFELEWRDGRRPPEWEPSEVDTDARKRGETALTWLRHLDDLIREVIELLPSEGWASRVIEVRLADPEIGVYRAPALLLQKNEVKLLLEPVAREAPGAQGMVDLYRMPRYDDIATLYFYDGRWNIHRFGTENVSEGPGFVTYRDLPAQPLTSDTLRELVDEMIRDEA